MTSSEAQDRASYRLKLAHWNGQMWVQAQVVEWPTVPVRVKLREERFDTALPSELIERRLTAILAADVAVRHAHKQPPAPGQAGIFALGSNSVLEHLLGTSGLVDVRTVAVQAPLRLASASDALQMMQEAFGAYRAVVSDLSEAAKANAWAEVAHCLRQFETESGFATRVGVRTRTSSEAG